MLSIYGYKIGEGLLFITNPPRLINLLSGRYCCLGEKPFLLLRFLLESAHDKVVSDELITENLTQLSGCDFNKTSLWRVVSSIEAAFSKIFFGRKLLSRINSKGYQILNTSISPLYVLKNDIESDDRLMEIRTFSKNWTIEKMERCYRER